MRICAKVEESDKAQVNGQQYALITAIKASAAQLRRQQRTTEDSP